MAGFSEILKHSGNYLIANLATRALAFISIPVYTRLLSTEDYGITAVFLATVGILNSLVALNFDTSISRYYYDQKSGLDFNIFVGTSCIASAIAICITSFIFYYFIHPIADFIALPVPATYLLIPMVILNLAGGIFTQIYQPLKQSKAIALSSLTRVYLGFAFSIGLIFVFKSEKYLGQIFGQILAGVGMLFYWRKKIAPYIIFKFHWSHLKYIINYSIPLIPYALSGVIIEQFGKLTVAANDGTPQAGFYTLAVSIASLTAIITEITHRAWYPYYMEYMKTKNYTQHDRDLGRIFRLTLIASMFFSCFGQEIGTLLAKKDFTSALGLVPILSLGYVLHQLSHVYMRNLSFALKTGYMSIVVISSGCANILLNSWMIPKWGTLGAAIAVVLSYALMATLSWFFSTYITKIRGMSIISLLKPLAILIVCQCPLYFVFTLDSLGSRISVKILLFILLSVILLRKDRHIIITTIQRLIHK